MAKQNINVGTAANDKKGDSLRAAFQKVNANFTELYTALGINADADLNLGNFVFESNTVRLTNANNDDSTATQIEIAQPVRIESDLTVGGDVVPNTANGGDLGSSTLPWRSLYVSNNTIYIGGTAVGVDANGNLTTGGTVVGSTPAWNTITGKPTFATVATSGAYSDLTGRPTSFNSLVTGAYSVNLESGGVLRANVQGIVSDNQLAVEGSTLISIQTLDGPYLQLFNQGATKEINLVLYDGESLNPTWTFDTDRTLTLPNDSSIKSATNIDITIDTPDSSTFNWRFGADGNLNAPGIVSAAGLRTSETKIALGSNAGQTSQGPLSVAIGYGAGATTQGVSSVAVGNSAGSNTQGGLSVAVGSGAGQVNQSYEAVAVGSTAGFTDQGTWSVAIGSYAGAFSQGEDAIAIGRFAGQTDQPDNTIILNASGSAVDGVAAQTNSFYVAPIRNIGGTSGVLQYNAATKEVSYSSDITSEGNINIDINLSDSTLRRWQFGEDGELTLPEDAVVKTTSGHLTIKGQNSVFIDSATNGQINIGTSSGVGAVVLGSKSRGTNVVVDDLQITNGVYEFFSSLADATGVVTHNCANGHLFYHTSPDANWTVNLTNLLDTWNRATSVTIIIAQGATGYYPSAVQIAGVAQTINWQGNVTPTPSTNRTDVVTFSIINNSGTYIVLGQLTGF